MKKAYSFLQNIWEFTKRHKYMITIVAFMLNLTFFSEYSLVKRAKNKIEIANLKSEINKYKKEYNKNTRILENMEKDPQYIEKVAREKYYMKKDNEDIFIIK